MSNLYQQYKEASLNTMAPGEILVKLFDEVLIQLKFARIHVETKDMFKANEAFSKAETIINTLNTSLDMKFPISQQLRPMYEFLSQQILQSNIKKDVSMIDEMSSLVRDLRGSFEQAEKLNRQSKRMTVRVGGSVI